MKHALGHKNNLPIGVFDSGMGGLTVLNALSKRLPKESFIYLGDTARLPYGVKSKDTVQRYASQVVSILVQYNIKLLVIACNTATAGALPFLRAQFPALPMVGVIHPSAFAAAKATKNNSIAVLATEATVNSGVYDATIRSYNAKATVVSQPCGLLVALAEEGCVLDDIARAVLNKYVVPLVERHGDRVPCDTILLGCTHFPVFKSLIRTMTQSAGPVSIIDSGKTTADAVELALGRLRLHNKNASDRQSAVRFLVTDSPERFSRLGELFFQRPIEAQSVKWVDLHEQAMNKATL